MKALNNSATGLGCGVVVLLMLLACSKSIELEEIILDRMN